MNINLDNVDEYPKSVLNVYIEKKKYDNYVKRKDEKIDKIRKEMQCQNQQGLLGDTSSPTCVALKKGDHKICGKKTFAFGFCKMHLSYESRFGVAQALALSPTAAASNQQQAAPQPRGGLAPTHYRGRTVRAREPGDDAERRDAQRARCSLWQRHNLALPST